MNYNYQPKPEKKLRADYTPRKANRQNYFKGVDEFLAWYNKTDKTCVYCGLTEEESQKKFHLTAVC